MINVLLALSLMFQTATPTGPEQPLAYQQVLEAHRAGVSSQGLLNMIASASSVSVATDAELISLLQSGVAPEVVEAYRARMGAPTAIPSHSPEDPRLADIVRLMRTGLSESLLALQIRSSGEVYRLSVNDLVFLKENQIPESVIAELIATSTRPAAPGPEPESSFGPFLRMTGRLKKNIPGTIKIAEERLHWLDGLKSERSFAIQLSSIKEAWLACSPRPQGNFCYALHIELFNRDRYEFRDLGWEQGDNGQILALFNSLKAKQPHVVFHERVQ